ncbi:LacI family transcriptional regulator [Pollutimonas nitritireducens]|uniref:LacI family transcriptional regulator n=1 Tax=Pollutimonas nitritireducens TaxID=2045209 RepID=A0A2N4UAT8_9BURK|nr:tripartite tricarboxylate transporter substrate binding protein [Pollutimonas nitritireducens]PLC52117.1 LacI family transcriptional regulator [Pollutimonas nitritireducens]
MITRALKAAAFFCSALTLAASASAASAFPTKPIRLIVPFSPGGGTDILARQLADQLTKSAGWNIVVENRPGGNGAIALSSISRGTPDGHEVILALRENIVITPLLQDAVSFNALEDFTAIVHVADSPMIIVSGADSKYKNIKQVLDTARQDPEALRFGTSGQGSMSHLLLAMLKDKAGAGMVHVPYKGSNPALSDMVGGHVELVGGSIGSAKSFLEGKRAVPLAVSSKERVAAFPDVPTISEQGYPDFNVVTWYGLFGPKGVPQDIVQQINSAVNKALQNPAFQSVLAQQGMVTQSGSASEFDAMFRADYKDLKQQLATLDM